MRLFVVFGFIGIVSGFIALSPTEAAATINGVSLAASANCNDNANLNIDINTLNPSVEAGQVSNSDGILSSFSGGLSGFNFNGVALFGQPFTPSQPTGRLIGSYGYYGESPPTAADTGEFFVAYLCSDTPGNNVVVYTCYGPYGTCPQTIAELKNTIALSTMRGVSLAATANCSSNANVVVDMNTVDPSQELGIVSNAGGILSSFSGGLAGYNFNGVAPFGQPFSSAQQENTLIGSYGRYGETSPTATNAIEFFVAYTCSDLPGSSVVVFTCYGPYGTCPQTITDYETWTPPSTAPSVPVLNLGLVQIRADAPVVPFGMAGAEQQTFSLPHDADRNGFDTYIVTQVVTVGDETWLALFVGSRDSVWVPYRAVTPLTPIQGIN